MKENSNKIDIAVLGVAVVDIIAYPADRSLFERDNTPLEKVHVSPGGDAVNQALGLVGFGSSVSLSCRLGEDTLGRLLLGKLSAAGIGTKGVVLAPESSTSCSIVLVSASGERNILCQKGSNYDFCLSDVDMNIIANARALSVGSIFGMPKLEEDGLSQVLRHAKKSGAVTFADMGSDKKNLRLSGVKPFLPHIDFFLPSETESVHLTGETSPEKAAAIFKDCGAGGVVIKLGGRGAYADIPGYTGYVNPFDISPVDTTGSGDAFCAGFIHSILSSKSAQQALEFASACGAFAALHHGASPPGMSVQTIHSFISATPVKKM